MKQFTENTPEALRGCLGGAAIDHTTEIAKRDADVRLHGYGFMRGGRRIDPSDVFLRGRSAG